MGKRPINGWWTGSIVCDQHDLLKFELRNDGVEVPHLIGCGVGILGGLIGSSPTKKVKRHDPARGREPGKQTVVEMQIVWKAMHQDDSWLLPWILTRIQVIGATLYDMLSVGYGLQLLH